MLTYLRGDTEPIGFQVGPSEPAAPNPYVVSYFKG